MTADPTPAEAVTQAAKAARRLLDCEEDRRPYLQMEKLKQDAFAVARAYLTREAAVARLVDVVKEVAGVLELQPPSKLGELDCSRLASWLRAAVTGLSGATSPAP